MSKPVTSYHVPVEELRWRRAFVSQHQAEGAGKVVGELAAVSLLHQREQKRQEQQEEQEYLQWQCYPAHAVQERTHPPWTSLKDKWNGDDRFIERINKKNNDNNWGRDKEQRHLNYFLESMTTEVEKTF